jgi:hypothetical protein
MKKIIRLGVVFFLLATGDSLAQSLADNFHSEILALYSFDPQKVTNEENATMAPKLDEFWFKIEHNKDTYLPLLRKELADYSNSLL